MSHTKESDKLSLLAAIFINLNIMVGVGLFINTSILAHITGAAGWVSYATLALLLLPLILSIAKLVNIYPAGGFYAYASDAIHPLAGFVSAWSYFTGKLASATIMTHASMLLLQQIIPTLAMINIFALDATVILTFLALNMLHLKTGKSVQTVFLLMKLIPILFVILSGLFLFSAENYVATNFDWSQFVTTIPLVLYAAIGFEATTSLSNNIQDAHKNGPRAILISYAIVMIANVLYQFFFYGSLGTQLQQTSTFLQAFPLLLQKFFVQNPNIIPAWQGLFNIAIASSALGGAFGIIFSNSWNLHTLAKHKHIINASTFLKENAYCIPYACVLAEGAICLVYLFVTCGNQLPLQQIAAFGCTIAYSLSILSLLYVITHKKDSTSICLPIFGLINCAIFFVSCFKSFYQHGAQSLYLFGSFMLLGIAMFFYTSNNAQTSTQLERH